MDQQKEKAVRRGGRLSAALFVLFSFLAVLLVTAARWEHANWDNLDLTEAIGQLKSPNQGTGGSIIGELLLTCVLPALLAAALAALLLFFWRGKPWRRRFARWGAGVAGAVALGMAVYGVFLLHVPRYVKNSAQASSYIADHYADPARTELRFPKQKRNLIYIWLESVEATFSDKEHGGAFDFDAIPALTQLAGENHSFTGTRGGVNGGCSMAGSTWTMGALFAQTSGLPLKIPITDSSMSSQESFFPGVTSLGDILEKEGYRQALLIGSNAVFGGRELYFQQHGGASIWDYGYAVEQGLIPEDYYVWWGYEDEKLFSFAREHLTELAAGEEPFALSLLTVDTHFPDGYVCGLCGSEYGDDQYSNVMACSARQVAAFVAWVQEQPFYENTTIVISGDHVTMNPGYCDEVSEDYQRRTYSTVIHPAAQEADPGRYRSYTTMDLFPTTLASLGVEIEGHRLGLGVDLFSGEETLLERDGFEKLDEELRKRSDFLNGLSGIEESVYRFSEELADLDTGVEASFADEEIGFAVHGLAPYQEQISRVEVFAELIDGNTRTTLSMQQAQWEEGNVWRAAVPVSALGGARAFTVNVYVTTEAGRVKAGPSYTCDLGEKTLKSS